MYKKRLSVLTRSYLDLILSFNVHHENVEKYFIDEYHDHIDMC